MGGEGVPALSGYLGVQLLRARSHELALSHTESKPPSRLFLEGAVSNISNPEIAVFYFGFLPQFVLPSAGQPAITVFALGLVFAGLTFLVKGPVGFGAGALSGWLRSRPKVLAGIHRFSGLVLLGLGVRLALERRT